jgi:hypothetical protein
MVFFPNEVWLEILTYCDLAAAWHTLRAASSQLKTCVEQHFFENVCPHLILHHYMALPGDDEEYSSIGRLTFKVCGSASGGRQSDRLWCHVYDVEPASYERMLLSEWQQLRLQANGSLERSRTWNIGSHGAFKPECQLANATVGGAGCGVHGDIAQLSFEWKPTLGRMLRTHQDLSV